MVKVSCLERFVDEWRKVAREEYLSALGAYRAYLEEHSPADSRLKTRAAVHSSRPKCQTAMEEAVRARYGQKIYSFIEQQLELEDEKILQRLREYMRRDTAKLRENLYQVVSEAVGAVRWGTHMITSVDGDIAGYVTGSSGTVVVKLSCRKANYHMAIHEVARLFVPPTRDEKLAELLSDSIVQVQKAYEDAHAQAMNLLSETESRIWYEPEGQQGEGI